MHGWFMTHFWCTGHLHITRLVPLAVVHIPLLMASPVASVSAAAACCDRCARSWRAWQPMLLLLMWAAATASTLE
ncbi:hypothetical protein COO60DRAFT_1547910 [Scenedesmus sp. NREL 46B-D3]|nr:hypothetical protein COO60DRAFT_1547910 [Scenedesmus sp. NREL 46B-D3]